MLKVLFFYFPALTTDAYRDVGGRATQEAKAEDTEYTEKNKIHIKNLRVLRALRG